MDRTELLDQISTASSPDEISTAITGVRHWLAEHPEDDEMHGIFQQLNQLERSRWASAAG